MHEHKFIQIKWKFNRLRRTQPGTDEASDPVRISGNANAVLHKIVSESVSAVSLFDLSARIRK